MKRLLGTTGVELSPVGFGAWAAGGANWRWAWGQQSDDDSIAAITAALDAGVDWIDTASMYGLGHSEELVGRIIAGRSAEDRPLVFTKCGLIWDVERPTDDPALIGRPESIRRECEGSLRRLGVDTIDAYQMHVPPTDGTTVEDYWGALAALRDEGKVRFIGLSNHSVEQLDRAEAIAHVDLIQPPFSAIKRTAAATVLPWAAEHGTGVIVYSPQQAGLLTGAFTRERAAALSSDDWRSREPEYRSPDLEKNLALAGGLAAIAARHGVSVGVVAIAWTLAFEAVSGAIVGARTPGQVAGWIDANEVRLDEDELASIARQIESTGAGEGPAQPPT